MKRTTQFLASLVLLESPLLASEKKPNIIVILSDDHGYTDLGIHGIEEDPNEFFDLKLSNPEKFKEMETALMTRYSALPAKGRSPLRGIADLKKAITYVDGAPPNTPADPRYLHPYKDGKPAAYPDPLKAVP